MTDIKNEMAFLAEPTGTSSISAFKNTAIMIYRTRIEPKYTLDAVMRH